MRLPILKLFVFLLAVTFAYPSIASVEESQITEKSGNVFDRKIGKRKRNNPSPASKRALAKQSKHAKRSIKRNNKRNKKHLKHRLKKQRKQKRFSRRDTFR